MVKKVAFSSKAVSCSIWARQVHPSNHVRRSDAAPAAFAEPIRLVWCPVGVQAIHETKRPIVDGQAADGHVVGVHDAMDKT